MDYQMNEYIEENKDELLVELDKYNEDETILRYFTDFINTNHYMNTPDGFNTKESIKLIRKFVTEDHNVKFLVFKQCVLDIIYEKDQEEELYIKKQTQLKALLQIKTYEQRTPDWYAFRKKILTASDLATAFGKGHFSTRDELILSKIDPKPWMGNQATEWGVKYEDVAIKVYERRNNAKILEFGLVPHPNISVFGASPDGIVADTGDRKLTATMLEIKCPWMRKIIHGDVPWHYWTQIQGQLESCDLDFCDFLQVKLLEYPNRNKYLEDKDREEKGVVVATWDIGQDHIGSPKYHYSDIGLTLEAEDKWMDQFFNESIYEIHSVTHWYIGLYSCYTVKRDKAWFNAIVPEIYRFREDLEYWKEQGKEKLVEHIASKKKKKGPKKDKTTEAVDFVSQKDLPTVCLL